MRCAVAELPIGPGRDPQDAVQQERPTAVMMATSAPMPTLALAWAVIPFAGTAAAAEGAGAEQPGS